MNRKFMLSWYFAAVMIVGFVALADTITFAQTEQSRGWRVWIRQEPCSGRFDWLSVSKESQGGGKNIYVPYETFLGNQGCTQSGPRGCTFQEATDLMESLRSNDKFFDFCCRSYSVWENLANRERSVVLGIGSPGTNWQQIESKLCCEEAEELAGKPGVCSGVKGGGKGNTGGAFGGNWTATNEYGSMTVKLTQSGNNVSGTLSNAFGSGKLNGTVSGKSLRLKWEMYGEIGSGEVTLANDGRSFSGRWTIDSSKTSFAISGTKDQ